MLDNVLWKMCTCLLNDSNTKDNGMINRRVSFFYRVYLEDLPPYSLSVYFIECLCSVSRHYCTGWLTPSFNIHMGIRESRLSTVKQTKKGWAGVGRI